jgi:sulfur relay (sulfurtransferase) DsrC/TusE family protein
MEWYGILATVLGAVGGIGGIGGLISIYNAKSNKDKIDIGNMQEMLNEAHEMYNAVKADKDAYRQELADYKEDTAKYISEFKERFPNVYKLIAHWKKRKMAPDVEAYMEANHLFPNKPTASLSMAMMNLESKIFTEILKRIYRKRWRAVHIHDCIVVPKTGKKNQPEKSEVLEIMREVYQQYGLCPTFD